MRKTTLILLLLSIVVAGCNLPAAQDSLTTPTVDLVATQIEELLAEQATLTLAAPTSTQPATATQPPTQTPAPSDTPVPLPTVTTNPGDPGLSLGEPSWQDALDSTKNFYLFENDNTKVEAESGALSLTGRNANGWLGWSLTYAQNPANFYLEATFRTRDCAGSDLYGVVFRANKENAGYFYGVTCDGRYNLYKRDFNNNTDSELIGLKSNAAVQTGSNQVNRLGILALGSKISLYVNGVLVEETTDDTYSSGYFGAFVAANQTAGFRVDLDHVKLWNQ